MSDAFVKDIDFCNRPRSEHSKRLLAINGTQFFTDRAALKRYCDRDYQVKRGWVSLTREEFENKGNDPTYTANDEDILQDAIGNKWVLTSNRVKAIEVNGSQSIVIINDGLAQTELTGTTARTILLPPLEDNIGEDVVIANNHEVKPVVALVPRSGNTILGSTGVETTPAGYTFPATPPTVPTGTKFYSNFAANRTITMRAFKAGWRVTEGYGNVPQTINVTNNISPVPSDSGFKTLTEKAYNFTTANQYQYVTDSNGNNIDLDDINEKALVKVWQRDPDTGSYIPLGETNVAQLKAPRASGSNSGSVDDSGTDSNIAFKPGGGGSGGFTLSETPVFSQNVNFINVNRWVVINLDITNYNNIDMLEIWGKTTSTSTNHFNLIGTIRVGIIKSATARAVNGVNAFTGAGNPSSNSIGAYWLGQDLNQNSFTHWAAGTASNGNLALAPSDNGDDAMPLTIYRWIMG